MRVPLHASTTDCPLPKVGIVCSNDRPPSEPMEEISFGRAGQQVIGVAATMPASVKLALPRHQLADRAAAMMAPYASAIEAWEVEAEVGNVTNSMRLQVRVSKCCDRCNPATQRGDLRHPEVAPEPERARTSVAHPSPRELADRIFDAVRERPLSDVAPV